jgi:hypothetical protein
MRHVRKTRRIAKVSPSPKVGEAKVSSTSPQRPHNVVGALLHHFRRWKPEALDGAKCQQLTNDV